LELSYQVPELVESVEVDFCVVPAELSGVEKLLIQLPGAIIRYRLNLAVTPGIAFLLTHDELLLGVLVYTALYRALFDVPTGGERDSITFPRVAREPAATVRRSPDRYDAVRRSADVRQQVIDVGAGAPGSVSGAKGLLPLGSKNHDGGIRLYAELLLELEVALEELLGDLAMPRKVY
jgi:hypothetical protein